MVLFGALGAAADLSSDYTYENHLPAANGDSAAQVAETLDRLVQPRFLENMGRFGVTRLVDMNGHVGISAVEADSARERPLYRRALASHRPFVIAFLHIRHKPGAQVDPAEKPQPLDSDFKPFVEALSSVGANQDGALHVIDWANNALTPVTLPYLPALRRGQTRQTTYENWVVVMRPVVAKYDSCVSCHAGTHRGDTLGVMVYAVDKNAKIGSQDYFGPGGE